MPPPAPPPPPRRILSIWLAQLAIDRWRLAQAVRAGEGADAAPLVLIAETAHGPRITAANRAGYDAGAAPGMMLADARAICPALATAPADPAGDLALPWVTEEAEAPFVVGEMARSRGATTESSAS